jgi:hypothetical protein
MKKLYTLVLCCLFSLLSEAKPLDDYLRLNIETSSFLLAEEELLGDEFSKGEDKNVAVDDCEAIELTVTCQDITVILDEDGTATITPPDIVTNFLPDTGYTIDQTGEFNPISLTGLGTLVSLSSNEVSEFVPIGFDFTFFEETYTEFRISSNGFITFDDTNDPGCCSPDPIPNSSYQIIS